jgi:hypothetical protein
MDHSIFCAHRWFGITRRIRPFLPFIPIRSCLASAFVDMSHHPVWFWKQDVWNRPLRTSFGHVSAQSTIKGLCGAGPKRIVPLPEVSRRYSLILKDEDTYSFRLCQRCFRSRVCRRGQEHFRHGGESTGSVPTRYILFGRVLALPWVCGYISIEVAMRLVSIRKGNSP